MPRQVLPTTEALHAMLEMLLGEEIAVAPAEPVSLRAPRGTHLAVYVDDGPRTDAPPSTIVDLTRVAPPPGRGPCGSQVGVGTVLGAVGGRPTRVTSCRRLTRAG